MSMESPRHTLQVFRQPEGSLDLGCASGVCGNCSSSASCGETAESFEEMLTRLYLGFGDRADIQVVPLDSSTEDSISQAIDTLKPMLEARRADVQLTKENFEEFISKNVPLIAVDEVLFFVGVIPSDEQMARALDIMSKSSE